MSAKTLICLSVALIITAFCAADSPGEKTLLDQEVTVLRGDFKEFHFLVPDDGRAYSFEGDFRCNGGFNDDITFLAVTQPAYVRWFSHYDYKPELKLEKKKEGTFRFEARPGETYYFVFDNFFSSVSNKRIKVRVNLVSRSQ